MESFENALPDVVLLGDADQIRLSREVIARLADGREASVDDLLVSFRKALREELDLKRRRLEEGAHRPVQRAGHPHPAPRGGVVEREEGQDRGGSRGGRNGVGDGNSFGPSSIDTDC
jgi:hypothetical protein